MLTESLLIPSLLSPTSPSPVSGIPPEPESESPPIDDWKCTPSGNFEPLGFISWSFANSISFPTMFLTFPRYIVSSVF